jgi:hypothetical protein
LQAQELRGRVLCVLQDLIDEQPRVGILFELVEGGLGGLLLLTTALVEGTHGGVELLDAHRHVEV